MCYAETVTDNDGTATAFCWCGWGDDYPNHAAADAAAGTHQRDADAAEAEFAAAH